MHYQQVIQSPRYEDYEIKYHDKNIWAHLGMGYTIENRTQGMDNSPYISVENIDPRWLEAVGSDPSVLDEQK